jgi:ATP-binding cassette subfamily F protein uup
LAIAEGFVRCPDLLLLDEPTNHLDLDGIAWLESALESFPGGVVFVSHDRYLIERTATKVVELHRRYPKGFILLEGSYSDFIEQRVEYLAQLETQRSALANKVRREVAWLRRGPKAQRSKSQARIKQAGDMIEELKGFQQNSTDVRLEFNDTGKRTKELIKLDQLGISYGEKRLIEGLTLTLSPGMRLGIVGGNGCGKSSLLKLINGELAPTKGQLWRLPTIQIGYFDQYRASLDPKVTLHNSLAPDGSHVVFNGREIHVSSWVTRFGLRADQLATRVGDLSGGEQARLAVARMMVSQSHLLLLDEPTNDLDIGTLEALEDALVEFEGALVVVSHDRYLLDRISTRLLALRGDGRWEFCASFPQWEELRSQWQADNEAGPSRTPAAKASAPADAKAAFSYKHHRELSGIDGKIQAAEALLAELQTRTEQPLSHVELTELYETVAKTQEEIDSLYERWGELEKLKQESEK